MLWGRYLRQTPKKRAPVIFAIDSIPVMKPRSIDSNGIARTKM